MKGIKDSGVDYITLQDVIKLSKFGRLDLTDQQIISAFCASKMTTMPDYEKTSATIMNRMAYVEFLEVICRLTMVRYDGSEMESLDLSNKLGYSLGDFLIYAGERYRHPEEEYEKPFSNNDISSEEIDDVVV